MKNFYFALLSLALVTGIVSCSSDETDKPINPGGPSVDGGDDPMTLGVFVVNNGNMYSNISGSLTYVEYGSGDVFDDVFSSANDGQTIGDIFNSGYVYGDNIYLAVTNSAVLHVIDRQTFKLKKTIFTPSNAGPRQITSYNGKIYITLFGEPGYVAEVDTETLEITRQVEVGPLPEYIVAYENNLYVAVSDGYGDGSEACVAVINPNSFSVTDKITGIVNPVSLATNGKRLFVCSCGEYMKEYPYLQYNYGVYEISGKKLGEKLCDGTDMWLDGVSLYYLSNPYGAEEVKYGLYDLSSNQDGIWIPTEDGVEYPIAIGADPLSSYIFVLSYHVGEGGYASYNTPAYLQQYLKDGSKVASYEVGISPSTMFFNTINYNE